MGIGPSTNIRTSRRQNRAPVRMRHRSTPSEFGSSAFAPSYPGTARQRAAGSQEEASDPTKHPRQSERDVATVCSVSLHSDERIPSRNTRKKNGKGPPELEKSGVRMQEHPKTSRAGETRGSHAGTPQDLPCWKKPELACKRTPKTFVWRKPLPSVQKESRITSGRGNRDHVQKKENWGRTRKGNKPPTSLGEAQSHTPRETA